MVQLRIACTTSGTRSSSSARDATPRSTDGTTSRPLCATEADYFGKLSPDSVLSLSLQGGPMSAEEVAAFEALPQHADAVQLRRYDEEAKIKDLETPSVAHFMTYVARCLRSAP